MVDVLEAIGVVNAVSALPDVPVIDSVVDSDPLLADHITRAPPTTLPYRSWARDVSSVDAPPTTQMESSLTRINVAAAPATPVACRVTDAPEIAAVSELTPTVSPIVHDTTAIPSESVADVAEESRPCPPPTVQATETPGTADPARVTATRAGIVDPTTTLAESVVVPVS